MIRVGTWMLSGSAGLLLMVGVFAAGCEDFRLPDPAVRYVAFGDSTADGPAEQQYWEILRNNIGAASDSFSGEGNGGESAADGIVRMRSLIDRGIFPNAHTIFYWQGAGGLVNFVAQVDPFLVLDPTAEGYPFTAQLNQDLDRIQSDIEAAIGAAQAAGWKAYVATYYPFREGLGPCKPLPFELILPQQAVRANLYQDMLNERIRNAAKNTGATLIDVAAIGDELSADPTNYFDCNHLSVKGNTRVAALFQQAIAPTP